MEQAALPARSAWPLASTEGRWSSFGPYYAMFPIAFVRKTVEAFCPPKAAVLDPFCGRGTVPYVARITDRPSLGIDLNAVAYIFSQRKQTRNLSRVKSRITDIASAVRSADCIANNAFQQFAWTPRVLGFLNAARRELDWRGSRLDRTLMALILVHLHAKHGNGISNQMRQSRSMAPEYAVRWWTQRGLAPPDLNPARYFEEKAKWRYAFGIPTGAAADIRLGDARRELEDGRSHFSMLLTSPALLRDYKLQSRQLDTTVDAGRGRPT